jgi:hypothetical protein
MDIEFHYYITNILAKEAGFNHTDSNIIAYSSQYVDDNNQEFNIHSNQAGNYTNFISQTMDILKPQKERMKIYPCFHFLPGDYKAKSAARLDGKAHIFNTIPNSLNANKVLDESLRTGDLYRIGIGTHCYADTWTHQNFVGFEDIFNECGSFLPNIGHADAGWKPDIPNLIWNDKRLTYANQEISNKNRFLDAAENIFMKFFKYIDNKASETILNLKWQDVSKKISNAIGALSRKEDPLNKYRIERYTDIVAVPDYNKKLWFESAIEDKSFKLWKKNNFEKSHWYNFQEAIKVHQKFVSDLIKSDNAENWIES